MLRSLRVAFRRSQESGNASLEGSISRKTRPRPRTDHMRATCRRSERAQYRTRSESRKGASPGASRRRRTRPSPRGPAPTTPSPARRRGHRRWRCRTACRRRRRDPASRSFFSEIIFRMKARWSGISAARSGRVRREPRTGHEEDHVVGPHVLRDVLQRRRSRLLRRPRRRRRHETARRHRDRPAPHVLLLCVTDWLPLCGRPVNPAGTGEPRIDRSSSAVPSTLAVLRRPAARLAGHGPS